MCANRTDFLFPFLLFKKNGIKGIIIHGRQYSGVKPKGGIFEPSLNGFEGLINNIFFEFIS